MAPYGSLCRGQCHQQTQGVYLMLLAVLTPRLTWDSLVQELGSSGRLNFFWEPMAAGKGGAENMAATTLMRVIHECICSGFLGRKAKPQRSSKWHHLCHRQRDLCPPVLALGQP